MDSCNSEALRFLDEASVKLGLLERLVSLPWDEYSSDYRNAYTTRMLIVEIVEALASACVRLLRCRGIDPGEGYVQVFRRAAEYLLGGENDTLVRLARLRNLIVHRYCEVDDHLIWRVARGNGVEEIRRIIARLRAAALGGVEEVRKKEGG